MKIPVYLDFGYHFVCLTCRRSMKRAAPHLNDGDVSLGQPRRRRLKVICPECNGAMICLGKNFSAPPRRDSRQWQKLEWMIQNGWRGYGSALRPSWPTRPKMNLSEVQESLVAADRMKQKAVYKNKENDALLERRRATKYNASHSTTTKRRMKAELKRREEYQTRILAEAQKRLESS